MTTQVVESKKNKQLRLNLAAKTVIATLLLLPFMLIMTVYAGGGGGATGMDNIVTPIQTTLTGITNALTVIVVSLGGVAFVFAGIMFFISSNERTVATAKAWMGRIIIGLALVGAANVIVNWAFNLIG